MNRSLDYSARRIDGIAMATLVVELDDYRDRGSKSHRLGLNVDEATTLLRGFSDEPLFKDSVGCGGWRPAIWLGVLYRDESVTTYMSDHEFRLWHCDDPDGGGEFGDRLTYTSLGPAVRALCDARLPRPGA